MDTILLKSLDRKLNTEVIICSNFEASSMNTFEDNKSENFPQSANAVNQVLGWKVTLYIVTFSRTSEMVEQKAFAELRWNYPKAYRRDQAVGVEENNG